MSQAKVTRTVTVKNPQGLHLRPIERFAKLANTFEAQIEVINDSLRADGKSVLHILTLGATQGTNLVIEAAGPDAEAALQALVKLVENDFGMNDAMDEQPTS
jgi:phosphotransferase system HPr (HPr) family protein